MTRRITNGLLSLLLGLALAACQPEADSKEAQPDNTPSASAKANSQSVAMVSVRGVNYQHELATKYTLFDLSQNPPQAIGGAIASPLESGNANDCCLALPAKWHPGIKVRVEWEEGNREKISPEKQVRDLEIPPYDQQPANLYVVFYWNHEVEAVVSPAEPGHPLWAGKIRQNPWDYCVAKNGRKPCWLAIPKPGLGLRELQGYCTYRKEENLSLDYCEKALQECIYNYEDEDLCKKTAWGPRKKEDK